MGQKKQQNKTTQMPALAIHLDLALPAASLICALLVYLFISQWTTGTGTAVIPKLSQLATGRLLPSLAPTPVVSTVSVRLSNTAPAEQFAEYVIQSHLVDSVSLIPGVVSYTRAAEEGKITKLEEVILLIRAQEQNIPALLSYIGQSRSDFVTPLPAGKSYFIDFAETDVVEEIQ